MHKGVAAAYDGDEVVQLGAARLSSLHEVADGDTVSRSSSSRVFSVALLEQAISLPVALLLSVVCFCSLSISWPNVVFLQ